MAVITCEDLRPPVMGMRHFFSTLSSLPLMLVPLRALCAALRAEPAALRPQLVYLMAMLTVLFGSNLLLHANGGTYVQSIEEMCAKLHEFAMLYVLNGVRASEGRLALPPNAAFLLAALGSVTMLCCTLLFPRYHHAAFGAVTLIASPSIVAGMGQLSYRDALAWSYWKLSCAGLVGFAMAWSIEPHLCEVPLVAPLFHSLCTHVGIAVLYTHVNKNVLHLALRDHGKRNR